MVERKEEILKSPEYFVSKPTGLTIFMRTSVPWQIVRFIVINLKMLKIIRSSHAKRLQ